MKKEKVQKSVDKIRDAADEIEEEVGTKKAGTHGDPVVDLY